MFKFYFDNNLVSDPENWNSFTETIERDSVIKGILPKYDNKLNFFGDSYKYLYEKYFEFGFCKIVNLKVEQQNSIGNFTVILDGYIFISDCKFNLNKNYVECNVVDNNYGARIYNNKSIKTPLISDLSKNAATITPAPVVNCGLFDCADCFDDTYARDMFTVYEAFRYLIAFMTDGTVGFESTYLETIGINITTGYNLRSNNGDCPVVSFDELFQAVNKIYPIAFTIVTRSGVPTVKIEEDEYFYSVNSDIKIENIPDLIQSFNNEYLYSGVRFGSETVLFNGALHHLVPRQFITFQDEEYFLTGLCNIDKKLDLYANYLIDSNMIEELLTTNTSNNKWDKNVFMISTTITGEDAIATPNYPDASCRYNDAFINEKVASRNKFAGDTTLYLGLDTSGFRAERTDYDDSINLATAANGWSNPDFYQGDLFGLPACSVQTSAKINTTFNDDSTPPNINLGPNYNPSNGRYTCPNTGNYYFQYFANLKILVNPPATIRNRKFRFTLYITQYTSGGTVVEEYSEVFPSASTYYALNDGVYPQQISHYFDCDATDYVTCAAKIESECENALLSNSALYINISNGSWFKTIATTSGGGVFATGDDGTYRASKIEFKNPLSIEKYDLMKSDLSKGIVVNHNGTSDKLGWIRKAKRTIATGEMDWELISNLNNAR